MAAPAVVNGLGAGTVPVFAKCAGAYRQIVITIDSSNSASAAGSTSAALTLSNNWAPVFGFIPDGTGVAILATCTAAGSISYSKLTALPGPDPSYCPIYVDAAQYSGNIQTYAQISYAVGGSSATLAGVKLS